MPRPRSRENREPSQRQLRVGEELRHALADMFQRGMLRDPALIDVTVTVTEVRLSPDLKNATAFIMPLGGQHVEEVMAGLKRSAGFLRRELARAVPLRYAPSVGFEIDHSFEHASRINALLHRPEVERDIRDASDDADPETSEPEDEHGA